MNSHLLQDLYEVDCKHNNIYSKIVNLKLTIIL